MAAGPAPVAARTAESDAGALVSWYRRHRRTLPWREQPSPYRVLVSEQMLQQTQVDRVLPAFERFVARFPDLAALAAAPEEAVLAAWSGLGYYGRARRLQALARQLVEGGAPLPRTPAELAALPGIGPYTAAAVAALAFDEAAAPVDGNVARVLSRRLGSPLSATVKSQRAALEIEVLSLMRRRSPAEVAQALMELGALVCHPRAPRCGDCPWKSRCVARAAGTVAASTPVRPRREAEERSWAAAVVECGDRLLVVDRHPEGLFDGTWGPPLSATDAAGSLAALRRLLAHYGVAARKALAASGGVAHSVTFRRIRVGVWRATVLRQPGGVPGARWVTPAELAAMPQSSLTAKLLAASAPPPLPRRRHTRAAIPRAKRS